MSIKMRSFVFRLLGTLMVLTLLASTSAGTLAKASGKLAKEVNTVSTPNEATRNRAKSNNTTNLDAAVSTTITDLAGNTLTGLPFTGGEYYTIDRSAPAVLSTTPANPSLASVDFTVAFSEAVTGVDISAPFNDFALTTTGVTGAAIAGVSGSGTTYTITVNTGSGNGTIRLDVVDDDSIKDVANNPLGGIGVGNGNYFGGETYTIDKIPPTTTSITRANSNPTHAASVDFTVTFSEVVTGVDGGDFALATTGVTGAAITGVSGSGTTYTVTVNTGSGNGTIRLDMVDDDSIKDATNSPLGGVGLGNGNYTSGETYTVLKGAGGDTTGVFRPSNGLLYLKNSNTTGFADIAINYGLGGDYPVVGDWDGNGTATIGIYRNGSFYLRNSNTLGFADMVFAFGQPGDQPVAGDWNGDGVDTIGVYRPSTGQFLLRDSNSAGAADYSFYLGNVGDVGIAGDWTAKGFDTVGVFRPSNGVIFLKNTNQTGFADIALNYGLAGDQPMVGDWNNDGFDTIGVYRNGQFLLRNSNTIGFADLIFGLGIPGDMPIAGNWDGKP